VAAAAGHMWLSLSLPGVHGLRQKGSSHSLSDVTMSLLARTLGTPSPARASRSFPRYFKLTVYS
jgi:hypothetical protein